MGCRAGNMMEDEVTASTRQALRGTAFEMPQNGLDPGALSQNASLLEALRDHRLDTQGLDAILSAAPHMVERFIDAAAGNASELMEVIVSCALGPDEQVKATIHAETFIWQGKLGLCGEKSGLNGETFSSVLFVSDNCRFHIWHRRKSVFRDVCGGVT